MALVLDDVTVVYRRRGVETHAVRGVSLRVGRGETLAVVGESGSGKTTIGKVAAGLQQATSGTVSRSGNVQMVFQHPVQSLDPMWRIRRAVREPLARTGLPHREAAALAAEMIIRVGLDPSVL
ncbi:MAG TPA: ATP-binding cassette domain-containing protein, partial [Nonomuraea sp.]|nr:ATP-binding cassette domain-containing protein [Nonomuraea sp.]